MTTQHVMDEWQAMGRRIGAAHMIVAAVPERGHPRRWNSCGDDYPVFVQADENLSDKIALYRNGGQEIVRVIDL